MSQTFQKRKQNFICANCGRPVTGTGYTNHCPHCLWSKHVDINPGDRAETCGGLMEPVGIIIESGEQKIVHKCVKCGAVKKNKVAKEDNKEKLIELAGEVTVNR